MIDSELLRNANELESANPKQLIDMYEPEPTEESQGTFEPVPSIGGRRYPLRERRGLITYANQYTYDLVEL